MEELVLKIKKLPHCKELPCYQTDGAAGMDIRAAIGEPVAMKPLQRVLIPTGFKIELPKDHEAQIRPRSGLAIKSGITVVNAPGTIDEDYRGEVQIGLVNLSDEVYTIQPDERIAQMIISKVAKPRIELVMEVSATERGAGGFGSTGRN